jgi:hypothetical protein
MKHPARLKPINQQLARRIEDTPTGQLPELARALLLRVAIATDAAGRAWLDLPRLVRFTGRPERAVRDAIVRASELPALLLFVRPETHATLPWQCDGGKAPPPDAWGFWLPDAAMGGSVAAARAACAASIREHIAHAGAYARAHRLGPELWTVRGEGVAALLGPTIAANDPSADNDAPAEDLRPELARGAR